MGAYVSKYLFPRSASLYSTNNLFSEDRINEIIKKSKFLEKTFDNSEALGYIRKEFREIHKYRHGGLNYLNERATIRRNNDISNT